MAVVDVSNAGRDAVLVIQKFCPHLQAGIEHGYPTPSHVICELDIEATRRAFPEMKGEILCRQSQGACVCVFEYERPAR